MGNWLSTPLLTTPPVRGEDTLPSDVWRIVFLHTRLPIPPPLSRPPRSALRQQTLTALARTCKLFNDIAIPILYEHVITDNPGRFFAVKTISRPVPIVPLPRALLAMIKSMYIEYQDTDASPSYPHLLDKGATMWHLVGPGAEWGTTLQMLRCEGEFLNIYWAIADHQRAAAGGAHSFTKLATVSVGSIYGHQGDLWSRFAEKDLQQQLSQREQGEDTGSSAMRRVNLCRHLWDDFLNTNKVAQVCIRDPSGPLAFPSFYPETTSASARLPQKTIHFSPDTPRACFHSGQNPTWVSDVPQDHAWNPIYEVVRDAMTRSMNERGLGFRPLQLDVFGSTKHLGAPSTHPQPPGTASIHKYSDGVPGTEARELSVGTQRAVAAVLGGPMEIRSILPGGRPGNPDRWSTNSPTERDTIRWFASHDYPGCQSCGSGPPL